MSGQARQNMAACSPRTRGWSLHVDAARRPAAVLPAHAGMVPSGRTTSRPAGSAPRARGDGPSNAQRRRLAERCSPRTRGWSLDRYYRKDFRRVLPAHAGMVPRSRTRRGPCRSAPRARGDGPVTKPWQCGEGGCSPRTRGWSPDPEPVAVPAAVLPAHAGMVPSPSPGSAARVGAPRARGDGPCVSRSSARTSWCSPGSRRRSIHEAGSSITGPITATSGMNLSRGTCGSNSRQAVACDSSPLMDASANGIALRGIVSVPS